MLRRGNAVAAAGRVKLICVLHPVGPLPASVYWRRRIVALAAALVAVLLLWLLGGSGGGAPAGSAAANSRSTSPSPSGTAAPPSDTLAGTPPAGDPGSSGTGGPSGSSGSSGDGSTGSDPPGGDGSAGLPGSTGPDSTQAAVPPPCPDRALRVTVAPARAAYPVGGLPVIVLSVQNVSAATCTRDLAASQQEVLLYRGGTRLWSSDDCYPSDGRDVQALAPGERDRFSVTWSGLSSRPRCAGTRTRVGAGHYTLVGRVGALRSAPASLELR
jgi:hypothetical protein